jgi:DNA invertase Pin-like site-specific DNA recombinase
MIVGYARVSTVKQELDAQTAALTAAGCEKMFFEKISGKDRERPELRRMLKRIKPGDVVVVTKIDRLARNTRDLLNLIADISDAGGGFRSIGDPIDTTTAAGTLVLQILASIAEFERKLIKARCDEGKVRARAKGTHMGRPRRLSDGERKVAVERRLAGESCEAIARDYRVSHSTISRL